MTAPSIKDESPFAVGTVLHMDRQGDDYRVRVWHDGSPIMEGHGVTAVGALAGIGDALKELGRTGIEAAVVGELRGMHDAIRSELLRAAVEDLDS